MEPVKVAIVGCGFMGRMHANVYGMIDQAQLVAVCDKSSDRAAKYAGEFGAKPYTDFDQMVATEALDAVDVCLPTHLHSEYVVRAAKAGKHVCCEKPMALTSTASTTLAEQKITPVRSSTEPSS